MGCFETPALSFQLYLRPSESNPLHQQSFFLDGLMQSGLTRFAFELPISARAPAGSTAKDV